MNKKREKGLMLLLVALGILLFMPTLALASDVKTMDFTTTYFGYIALAIFFIAYLFVIFEDKVDLRKSKPVIVSAGLIWVIVAWAYKDQPEVVKSLLNHNLLEYVSLLLFLLSAMTYINTMSERNIFAALRGWLVSKGFSFYAIFWITGVLAFVISPLADNLTTALVMSAVVITSAGGKQIMNKILQVKENLQVAKTGKDIAIIQQAQIQCDDVLNAPTVKFVILACINVVVAANAGGAFSPFGDITTLMVWQAEKVEFTAFFALLLPSIVNWIIPALIMSFFVTRLKPKATKEKIEVRKGGWVVVGLFILTISMAVSFHSFLHLPPMMGMMLGLGFLKLYGYYLKNFAKESNYVENSHGLFQKKGKWDIFNYFQRAEWDTLMFFYGVILSVGGLGALGYLSVVSEFMYIDLGATTANILVGIFSAIIDNIPVMFAVLTMNPVMPLDQWLLVTLTAGVGGSLLSVGSAAGVALMGSARGIYTFMAHLKWTWAIALGYIASIWLHFLINT